jgi:hypothetical protein
VHLVLINLCVASRQLVIANKGFVKVRALLSRPDPTQSVSGMLEKPVNRVSPLLPVHCWPERFHQLISVSGRLDGNFKSMVTCSMIK